MYIGNIAEIFQDKKYGLIRTEDGKEVHFHDQCLWGVQFQELTKGQKVEFEMQSTNKGYLGFQIRRYVDK